MNTGNHFEQAAAAQRITRRVRAGQPLPPEPPRAPRAPDPLPSTWRLYLSDLAIAALLCAAVMAVTALAVVVATL